MSGGIGRFFAAMFGGRVARPRPAPLAEPTIAGDGALVLEMFRDQQDTHQIAAAIGMPEWQVANLLQQARDAERAIA